MKLDINGAEYNALKGASETISKKTFYCCQNACERGLFFANFIKKIAPKIN